MQIQKKHLLILSVLVLILSSHILWGQVVTFKNAEDYTFAKLRKTATERGSVRIIIKMNVPALNALTARSRAFTTGSAGDDISYKQRAINADMILAEAISLSKDSILHQLNHYPYKLNGTLSSMPYMGLSVPVKTLERLKSIPQILEILEDEPIFLPQEPYGEGSVDAPVLTESPSVIGADYAWQNGITGSGWYVAVLDTGIRRSHQMFQGKDVVEACFAVDAEGNGLCPNGKSSMTGPGAAVHDYDHSYVFGWDHGTHVAGIAAGNNGSDRFGVAKDAGIIAIQVFGFIEAFDGITSWNYDQLAALDYLYSLRFTYNIASVNMSLGSGFAISQCPFDVRSVAIDNLKAVGIATCIASGNDYSCTYVGYPACVPGGVSVNASDKNDIDSPFGNWNNDLVDVMAPGVDIISSVADSDIAYDSSSGTSQAAPHVAGAWALIKQLDPTMSVDDALTILKDSGKMVSSSRCPALDAKPRISIGDAVSYILFVAPPKNVSAFQQLNKSYLQKEYVNIISWETNKYNDDTTITNYKVYTVQGSQLTYVGQVDGNTLTYLHRGALKNVDTTYAITAVNSDGEESPPAYYTLNFVITQ